ncbi:fimbrial protein [Escherichia fergusonii]|uniref:fimbrial protein n=1 Tax=Escherichia fergusonii TaxID=564 RepID=UPI0006148046|nr:fimbrial protein [Escherichia fergusonii]EFL4480735.1 fimbrial protein [Escherichia fergusonii]KWW07552.1 fimbrial protein [Escherichia fergusonii]MBA5615828.1 fimbrial protein [Escherichia fergusonii]MBA5664288.1 fimbrial protein [Escherichia fergusonii]MBA8158498.1 fimbrial protein [Escherichia fergusonii]
MNTTHLHAGGYALLAGLMLTGGSTSFAVDNNLHFYGNLLSKSCTLVVDGQYLAEVHFPTVSRQDLNVAGQSARVPVVFKLKDCKGPAGYNVKVTLVGVEDSEQPGFLALDSSSTAHGVGIGMEKTDGTKVAINNTSGATFTLTNGNNNINFRAWLQAKSGRDVTIGDFTASVTATFEYI